MDKIKRIVCVILALCFTVAFTSCGDKTPQDVETTTQNTENNAKEEITFFLSTKNMFLTTSGMRIIPKCLSGANIQL